MHKEKLTKFVFKNKSHEEIVDIINQELPLNLKNQQNLIDRIYLRYPYIKKYEISIIVMTIFSIIRDNLILGNTLNFYNLFFNTKIMFFNSSKGKSLKMKIKNKTSRKFG